jgi:hypothetical protein
MRFWTMDQGSMYNISGEKPQFSQHAKTTTMVAQIVWLTFPLFDLKFFSYYFYVIFTGTANNPIVSHGGHYDGTT